MPSHHTVVGRADDFGQQQNLEFSSHADGPAALAEGGEAPMRSDGLAAKAIHCAAKQARVFTFFGEPKVHDDAHLRSLTAEPFRIVSDERGRAAAIAELELLE